MHPCINIVSQDYEIYCNTDADKVSDIGFNYQVRNRIDRTLTCGAREVFGDIISLRTLQIVSGDCSGLTMCFNHII